MLFLAVKNLVQEKTRLLISVGGVAFSVLLIMSIQGLYQGWSNKIGEYIRTVPADYWITQAGAADLFHHTPSVLPLSVRDFLSGVPGSLVPSRSARQDAESPWLLQARIHSQLFLRLRHQGRRRKHPSASRSRKLLPRHAVKENAVPGEVASRIEADPAVDDISEDRFVESNTNIVRDTSCPSSWSCC